MRIKLYFLMDNLENIMNLYPLWQYDEMRQIGIDYEDEAEVQIYDQNMQKLRNTSEDIDRLLDLLRLKPDHTLLDIGTGTGELAIAAARRCSKVFAIDVSSTMLKYAERKAKIEGLNNITFYHAGFLTYRHLGEPLNVVVTQLALHHLPDFWKQVALLHIWDMLEEGGKLYLEDAIYSFDPNNWECFFKNYISDQTKNGIMPEYNIVRHFKEEFSTFSWIIEGMITRANFRIDMSERKGRLRIAYICTKP